MQSKIFEEIKAGLDILFEPGQTFEVRALNGSKIAAGYFRDTAIAAEQIIRIEETQQYAGIYITINPVNPALYYRKMDRIVKNYKEFELTKDVDVVSRRWLIVDLDPKRPSGISASDDEKKLAETLLPSVRSYLTVMGFPEPIIADSGNGFHLLYNIDLPVKSPLVKDVLTRLNSRFSSTSPTAACDIDVSVSNAARIMKAYGTMARKGDDSEERPHRRSHIMSVPNEVQVVPVQVLERLAYPDSLEPVKEARHEGEFKPVTDYLDEWGITYGSPIMQNGEIIYKLDDCPFSTEHSDGAYVSQNQESGAIKAACYHNSCGGRDVNHWKELRARFDKFYDIGPNLFDGGIREAEDLPEFRPEDVKYHKLESKLSINNFVTKYVNYWKTRTDAYPEYHHAAALGLLSIAADRVLVYKLSSANIYTNVWSMCLGKSSISRKSTAITMSDRILDSGKWLKPFHRYPGMFSTEGLIEEMSEEPRGYMTIDECNQLLSSINQKKYLSDLRDVLCKIYDCQGTRRKLRGHRGKTVEFSVENPYATFLYATTHENFLGGCNTADITSGWLVRFLYFFPQYPKDSMGIHDATGEEEHSLSEIGNIFWEIADGIKRFDEIRCSLSPFGFNYFNNWLTSTEKELLQAGVHGSVFQRYAMYSLKLAALYYIGDPGTIDTFDASQKQIRIIIPDEFIIESIRQINDYFLPISREVIADVSDAATDNIQTRILMFLRGEPNRTAARSKILRYIRKSAREINEAIDTLEEAEMIRKSNGKLDASRKASLLITLIGDCE